MPALACLTLHDLLQLHLQGLDGTSRMISHSPFDPVDGQTTFRHSSDVAVFQEDDSVRVLDHSTVPDTQKSKKKKKRTMKHTLKTSVSNMILPNIFNKYNAIIQPVWELNIFYCTFIILPASSPSYKPNE